MITATLHRSPWMTDELALLRETTREFLRREAVPNRDRWDAQHHVDRDFWNRAGELGLLCASVPEEYGGGGGTFATRRWFIEELGYTLNHAFGYGVHSTICAHYILNCGTEEQKRRWLPKMASASSSARSR